MRSAQEYFDKARAGGAPLTFGEATVVVADASGGRRTWLGYQGGQSAVAYFETRGERKVSFSVSQVISVESVDVNDDRTGAQSHALRVVCHDARLDRVFFVFIDEVRSAIDDADDVVEVVQSAASEWRRLLQVAMTELSETVVAGVYGELRFLEGAVERLGPSAVEFWQRTSRDMHDFTSDFARVEVKTSAFQDRSAVTIHGLRQLEPPMTGTLTLAVAEIQRHGEDSLDQVAERLRHLGVDHAILAEKLFEAGYVEGMPCADEFTFGLHSWRFWEIDAQTAALNRSAVTETVADAVSSLSYSLNLGSLGDSASVFDYSRLSSRGRTEA